MTTGQLINHKLVVYGMACLVLFYVVIRAMTMSLTFDEVITAWELPNLSYSSASQTANTHLLNSYLAGISVKYLGESEFTLRLPNVMAALLYVVASVRISSLLAPDKRTALFVLLVANPFVLDFFSLCRGYGLATGFLMLSMLFFVIAVQSKKIWPLCGALLSCMCGVLANYTLIYFLLPLGLSICLSLLLSGKSFRVITISIVGCIALILAFLLPLLPILFRLKDGGHLIYGGTTNFFVDTIISLGKCLGYHSSYAGLILLFFVGLFFTTIILAIQRIVKMRKHNAEFSNYVSVMLIASTVLILLLHMIFENRYPVERTAIAFYPIISLVFFTSTNDLKRKWGSTVQFSVAVVVITHFVMTMNLTHTYSWRYDSGTKNAMLYVNANTTGEVRLGVDYLNVPSAHYYRNYFDAQRVTMVSCSDMFWFPLRLEEVSPYYFGHTSNYKDAGFCYYDSSYFLSRLNELNCDLLYLDEYYINVLNDAKIKFQILEQYPYSRTYLIRIAK